MTLSTGAATVLQYLRGMYESEHEAGWGTVYLDNVLAELMRDFDNFTPRSFAGYLSTLKRAGLYRPYDDGEFDSVWGDVKLWDVEE